MEALVSASNMSPALWVRRNVRQDCLGLLSNLVAVAKAAPDRLETLGASVQLILWRLSECFLEEQAPSAVASSPDALVAPASASLASELVGLGELVVLHAPAALQPFFAVCQPLPRGEHCCSCYMSSLVLLNLQVIVGCCNMCDQKSVVQCRA
jgi:hypothetical protein